MLIVKPHIDVGLFTNSKQPMLDFWQQEVGLRYEETLSDDNSEICQFRHGMRGSILKLNYSEAALKPLPPSGLRELLIVSDTLDQPDRLQDADNNLITKVPPGWRGIENIAVRIAVSNLEVHHHFYGKILGLESVSDSTFICGNSLLFIEHDPDACTDVAIVGKGFRYLTIQVQDCRKEHQAIIDAGGTEGTPPQRLRDVAIYSMVRDPDGNWIEISQRASLTGPLPE